MWERCRKHTLIAVIGPILKPNPFLTTCVLQKLRHFQEPPREPFIQLSNCSFPPQGASSWKISNSSPSQNSAGIHTCHAGTAGKVFHYPIKLLVYPCPSWRLPEITATPVRLMLCLFFFSFFFLIPFFYQLLVILKILIPANMQQCKSFYKDLVSGTLAYVYSWFLSNKVNLSHIFPNRSSSHTHRKKK